MEEAFTNVVEHIFNNWSALKLAVQHGMGGPNSTQVAIDCKNFIIKYCLEQSNVEVDDIQEALEDLMDEEFETICEDNSPREIAVLLHRFIQLLKEGNFAQCTLDYNNLPKSNEEWLIKSTPVPNNVTESATEDEIEDHGVPMEEDPEWTTVKSKKKR